MSGNKELYTDQHPAAQILAKCLKKSLEIIERMKMNLNAYSGKAGEVTIF